MDILLELTRSLKKELQSKDLNPVRQAYLIDKIKVLNAMSKKRPRFPGFSQQ